MKKIHVQIALVGGQPTPVYQGIVHLLPDQVVLVCSEMTEKVAEHIREQLPSYDKGNVIIYKISDKDVATMYKEIEEIEQAIPKGISMSLNITGGMTLWSVIFNNVFRRKRRSCRTFCLGQDGSFFDMKEKLTVGKVAFDMDAQFKILGHQLDEFMPLTDYTAEDFAVLNVVQSLGFNTKTHMSLFRITQQFVDEYKKQNSNILYRKDHTCIGGQDKLEWKSEQHEFKLTLGDKEYTFASPHVEHIVLNTGWFELYVARLIAKKYEAKNVRLNCVFRNVKGQAKNEIDIIVNTGSKLIFVECKTQIFNATDIDKFRSAVRNYGGLGSKPLFITNWQMKPDGLEKCNDHRIATFYTANADYTNQQERVDALSAVLDNLNKTWNV